MHSSSLPYLPPSPSLPPCLRLLPFPPFSSSPLPVSAPFPSAYITRCEVHSVYKRATDRRYVYMIQVEWSDGTLYTVRRTYGDFFSFQTKVGDSSVSVSILTSINILWSH